LLLFAQRETQQKADKPTKCSSVKLARANGGKGQTSNQLNGLKIQHLPARTDKNDGSKS
jgi:hypothetical protein